VAGKPTKKNGEGALVELYGAGEGVVTSAKATEEIT
jgi:hypothetical protein